MRALMIPQIVSSGGVAEGNFYSMQCIMRGLSSTEPSFCYLWLCKEDEDRIPEEAGQICLYEERRLGFYPQMAAVDLSRLVQLFSRQTGLYPVDVIFTSRAGVAPLLALALADRGGHFPVPVVLTEPRVYGPGERGHNQVHPTQMAIRAAGYATCFGMYWSEWERSQAIEAASAYVSAGVVKAMEDRAFVVDALVDVDGLVKHVERPSSPKRLLFAGRLNTNKRYREVVEAYGKVLMARPTGTVEVWVHSGTGAFVKFDGTQHRWHTTTERLSRDDYWRLLGSSHVSAYLSQDEGANVTVQELLASGVVMALPDRPWVEHLFAPLRYPFLVKTTEELPSLVDWLLDHYEEASDRVKPIRELIERERAWPAFLSKFFRLLEAVRSEPRPVPYRKFREVVTQLGGRRHGRVPFGVALRTVPEWSEGIPLYTEASGVYACYEAVRDWDDYASADPLLTVPA